MSSNEVDDTGRNSDRVEGHQSATEIAAGITVSTEGSADATVANSSDSSPRSETLSAQAHATGTMPQTTDPMENSTNSEIADKSSVLKEDDREKISDRLVDVSSKKVENDQTTFHRKVLTRLSAIKVTFKNVSFYQTVFDTCYFNNCVFDSCSFVGCRFVACNLNQSTFPGCKFEYAIFERTQVDDDILNSAPERNNLKLKFARTLRMNYQQIGDAKAVNRAIIVELEATDIFLKESWSSNSDYYRKKYVGLSRIWQLAKWIEFRALDFIWGNGESVTKLLRSIIWVILGVAILDMIYTPGEKPFTDFLQSFFTAPALFLGVKPLPDTMPPMMSACIAALRLLGFAFLTAILVKRFGRR